MKTLAVLSFGVLAALSLSSDITSLNSTKNGVGKLYYATVNHRFSFKRASVSLNRNGSAQISIQSGATETFSGTWTITHGQICTIAIDHVGNNSAKGTGTVEHDNRGNVVKFALSADVNGGEVSSSFTSTDKGGLWGNGNGNGQANSQDFLSNARLAIQSKYGRNVRMNWANESVGKSVFGNVTVKGEFTADGTHYRYSAVVGSGSGRVQSASYSKM